MIPYIDIFAGPGGLGEGFARYANFNKKDVGFEARLSIEKDPVAAQTLTLRTFFHKFEKSEVPDLYYESLRTPSMLPQLHSLSEWQHAEKTVWNAELGSICNKELHARIRSALRGKKDWVLLGGPPCQAYSLVGRSRMTGLGSKRTDTNGNVEIDELEKLTKAKLKAFYDDHRHHLYREYLRIVAVHQPAIFVMENVKGILSSKIPSDASQEKYERIFPRIRDDLSNPWKALETDEKYDELQSFRKGKARGYKLYSFTVSSLAGSEGLVDNDFLIRSEDYGVPQRRHRVIILGIRDDLDVSPKTLKPSKEVTVQDMIRNMSPLRSGLSKEEDVTKRWLKVILDNFSAQNLKHIAEAPIRNRIKNIIARKGSNLTRGSFFEESNIAKIDNANRLHRWIADGRLRGVLQHETRAHMNSDLGRYLFAACMSEKTNVTPKLNEWPSWLLPSHQNVTVDKESGKIAATAFNDRFRVQAWGKPATTITSHISKDGHYYIHPDPEQCRSLTVREAARLQTFPDNYLFCGNRTQQYHQVGNAVPPWLAQQLAGIVADLLIT